jgi:hypothetical protein
MNVAMGKISPQYNVIFDNEFETVISLEEGLSLEKEWENILCLKQECYKEVDYNDNSQQLLPPLASILANQQQALHDDYNEYIPMTLDQQTPQEVPELNKFKAHQGEEIALPEGDSQEKATTTSTLPAPNLASPYLASTENAVPEGDIGLHENSNASTWPCWNVGTYKQGPAKIRKISIDGKSYDFSFTLKTNTHSYVQTKYHPTQKISKTSLVECYLLQDDWTSDKNYLRSLDSNIILDL